MSEEEQLRLGAQQAAMIQLQVRNLHLSRNFQTVIIYFMLVQTNLAEVLNLCDYAADVNTLF